MNEMPREMFVVDELERGVRPLYQVRSLQLALRDEFSEPRNCRARGEARRLAAMAAVHPEASSSELGSI